MLAFFSRGVSFLGQRRALFLSWAKGVGGYMRWKVLLYCVCPMRVPQKKSTFN